MSLTAGGTGRLRETADGIFPPVPHASPQLWAAMLVANHRRHAQPASATPSHSRPIATGSPHRRLPISAFLRSLSAPPRSRPEQPRLCAHHAKEPLLCALLIPFPRSPLAFSVFHVILPTSPGPPSLAARLWRSFDGGVGKERTSKAIASPRAQERIEPVACRQKSSRLLHRTPPPEAAPPGSPGRTAK